MKCDKTLRQSGMVLAFLALTGWSQSAMAQTSSYAVQAQIRSIGNDNPGSTLVYAGCRSVADNEYAKSRDVGQALSALAVCAAMGCALTDDYKNCLNVNAQLFLLELRLS